MSKFGGFLVQLFSVPFRPLKEKGILDLVQTDPYKNWLFSSLLQKIIKSKMVGKQNRRKKIEWQKLNTQIYWNYVQYQSKFNEKKQKKKSSMDDMKNVYKWGQSKPPESSKQRWGPDNPAPVQTGHQNGGRKTNSTRGEPDTKPE